MTAVTYSVSFLSVLFDCRFLSRTLGNRYRATPAAFIAASLLYGWINGTFGIATTLLSNCLYFFAGNFTLSILLFHGCILKKLFFILFVQSLPGVFFYILLPLSYIQPDNSHPQDAILLVIFCLQVVFQGLLLEFAGRKLQSLRNDLPAGYLFYSLLTAFVSITIQTLTELCLYSSGDSIFWATLLGSLFAMGGMLILIFTVISVDRQLSQRLAEQQAALQAAHFKSREEDWRQMARFRHDINNHLLCLRGLLLENKTPQAMDYLDTLTRTMAQTECRSTGNDYVDAILNEKQAAALSLGITFTGDMTVPPDCRIAPMDLCCIFSNVLDNAIHACQQAEPEKWIRIRAFVRQTQLVIEVKNSIRQDCRIQGASVPLRREQYGIGLENVNRTITKYGGVMDLSVEDCFTFSAMIPTGVDTVYSK